MFGFGAGFDSQGPGGRGKPRTLGASVVVNGTFNADTTSWTPNNATLGWNAAGRLDVTSTDVGNVGAAEQTLTLVSGASYRVTVDITAAGSGARVNMIRGATGGFAAVASLGIQTTPGTYFFEFVASGADFIIRLNALANGNVATFDNVKVQRIQ